MSVETYSISDAVLVTPAAAAHFKSQLDRLGGKGVRFSVKKSGCSGFAYVIDQVEAPLESDIELHLANGVALFIDADSLPALRGTEIDYTKEGLNSSLKLNNPNVKGSCGCGESFSV